MGCRRGFRLTACLAISIFAIAVHDALLQRALGQATPTITVDPSVPNELNPPFNPGPPPSGGALAATPAQAYAFAWQEFIALNWPAGPQQGQPGQRETPSPTYKFGDPSYTGPLVWQTFRGKVEIFPGNSFPGKVVPPPGYRPNDSSFGYDALPVYSNSPFSPPVNACDQSQKDDQTPWINLDETDQITLDNMYAGAAPDSSPGNSSPHLIRFLAKANRLLYVYVAGNSSTTDPDKQWWSSIPVDVVRSTKAYLADKQASPPPGSKTMVSLPMGTIEIKAAWRALSKSEMASGRFHTQTVRFYEFVNDENGAQCYHDATWGLVALHIIQKTPSAPYFIYATFEQADNLLTANGARVENENGRINPSAPTTATSPQVCLNDPRLAVTALSPNAQESTSNRGSIILTTDPSNCKPATVSYCNAPGNRLYLRNSAFAPPNNEPNGGHICINKRENSIPDDAIAANTQAHTTIAAYLKANHIQSAPWLFYKLVNVQYIPYDKIINAASPNGSLYTAKPPYTATNPAPSTFYQANIVVETNRSLQLFSGGLSPNISSDWNEDGTPHKNTYYGGHFYNMGGCLGCHGSQGQNPPGFAGDFSVILARGSSGTANPESPAKETSKELSFVPRNRILSR